MNANELADELKKMFVGEEYDRLVHEIPDLLRQQHEEIVKLKLEWQYMYDRANMEEPKPVLYINEETLLHGNGGDTFWDTEVSWWPEDGFSPLYTHTVKELTDEEIEGIARANVDGHSSMEQLKWFARAILRKAQEK